MDKAKKEVIEAATKRYELLFESASPFKRWRMRLKAFYVWIILCCPVLIPSIVGGLLFAVAYAIGGLLVPQEYSKHLYWICLAIVALLVLPWAWRNMKFVDFVADDLRSKKDEDASKSGK